MKKHLSILACLLLPFAAVQVQAQQTAVTTAPAAPAAQTAPAPAATTVAPNHVTATAKSQQNRHAKDAACQKAAREKGLSDLEFKKDVIACMH